MSTLRDRFGNWVGDVEGGYVTNTYGGIEARSDGDKVYDPYTGKEIGYFDNKGNYIDRHDGRTGYYRD